MIARRGLLLTSPAPAQAQAALGETLAPGLRMDTLFRWGDRVLPDAPRRAPHAPSAEQRPRSSAGMPKVVAAINRPRATARVPRLVVAVAHPILGLASAFPDSRDRPDVAPPMQGASIVNIGRRGGR